MPCEPDEVEPTDCDDGDLLIADDGTTLRVGTEVATKGVGYYRPHWNHCPTYRDFKKKKGE